MNKIRTLLKSSIEFLPIRRFSSFTYLNVTQFLGALNDNIYKFLIGFFLIGLDGIENAHRIMAFTGATFVLPFLLFSASSGWLADRISKRNIIIGAKLLELVVMIIGLLVFYFESKIGAYGVLFLLASHSALFGPSKYGILPELVSTERISQANGLMTSFTFLAIILGTFLASFMLDASGRSFITAALITTAFSLIGLATSVCIEYTPPAGTHKRFNLLILNEIYASLKVANSEPSLLCAVIASAYFLFLGAFLQLNIVPFSVQSLHLTDLQGGYLFLVCALGIGTGSLIAGKISGKIVELGLVPVAALGVTVCCYLLDLLSNYLLPVIPLLGILGMFGGIYQIPNDSYIQVASPNQSRGQIVAATNFLSFFGVLCASALVFIVTEVFHLQADKGFTIIGTTTLFAAGIIAYQYFDYTTRFFGMVLSRLHFETTYKGIENIPEGPSIYLCHHQAWNETLIILGAQRRRMRFLIENEKTHESRWLYRLYHLLRVVLVPAVEPLENNAVCVAAIQKSLAKGISVCIFVNNPDIHAEIEKIRSSYQFNEVLESGEIPIVPIHIEKGEKDKQPRFFKRLLNKFRIPAEISFGALLI